METVFNVPQSPAAYAQTDQKRPGRMEGIESVSKSKGTNGKVFTTPI